MKSIVHALAFIMLAGAVQAETIEEHRSSIDRIDAIILFALGERFEHTTAIGHIKADEGIASYDPNREAEQNARLIQLSKLASVDPDFAKKLLKFISTEVVKQHNLIKKEAK